MTEKYITKENIYLNKKVIKSHSRNVLIIIKKSDLCWLFKVCVSFFDELLYLKKIKILEFKFTWSILWINIWYSIILNVWRLSDFSVNKNRHFPSYAHLAKMAFVFVLGIYHFCSFIFLHCLAIFRRNLTE